VNVEQLNEVAVARIAGAIGEPARARMLFCLMDGHARIVRQWSGYSTGHSGDRLTASIEEALKDDGI